MSQKMYLGKTIEIDSDGNLCNLNDWNEELAIELAKEEGIDELKEGHWKVLNFMRDVYKEKGDAPSMRRLGKESGVNTKELYTLFPKGPAKKAAKISGLPKPKGCI